MAGITNYNSGIPTTAIPVGELVALTTGSTVNGTTSQRSFSAWTCTKLVARVASATVTLKQEDTGGANVVLPVGNAIGDTLDFSFTGYDIIGWNGGAVMAMCYDCNPCGSGSGNTIWTGTQNKIEVLGSPAFQNVVIPARGANRLPV